MKNLDLINTDHTEYDLSYVRNETVNLDYRICLPPTAELLTDRVQRLPESITIIRDCIEMGAREELLDFLQATNNWQRSLVMDTNNPESENRSSETYMFDKFGNKGVNTFVHALLTNGVQFYKNDKPYRDIAGVVDSYYAIRYSETQEYKVHCDQGPGVNRSVSAVFYLNDNYEGGEIYFPNQEITLKPKAGDLILFPSSFTHAHASLPVQTGTKYAIVSWWV